MHEKLKRCPECHTLNSPDAKVCKKCGSPMNTETNQSHGLDVIDKFTDSSNIQKEQSGTWEMGNISVPSEDDFYMGENSSSNIPTEIPQKKDTNSNSVWSGIEKKRSTIGVSRDRRDALVEALKTIRGVIKKRKENEPQQETVNALGEDPETIQTVDPFSELALKSTIRREDAELQNKKRTLNPLQRDAAAFADSVQEEIEESPVEQQIEITPDSISTEMHIEPEENFPTRTNNEETVSDTIEMDTPPTFDSNQKNTPLYKSQTKSIQNTNTNSHTASYTTEVFEVLVASKGIRMLAFLIDLLLVSLITFTIVYIALKISGKKEAMQWLFTYSGKGALRQSFLLFLLTFITYFTSFTWLGGATIGKMVAGIKVIDMYGDPPSYIRSMLRTLIYFIDMAMFGIGFFMIFLTEHDRALHDKIVGTYVIDES